ncbi:MAG: hypothetical protein E4H30_08030 [Methanomassiliicoccus sp.]|nr:MAG: hypothetical protein E4H30_08030 [Methanomassiliicoccus sp.]
MVETNLRSVFTFPISNLFDRLYSERDRRRLNSRTSSTGKERLRRRTIDYLQELNTSDEEKKAVLEHLVKNELSMYPYAFMEEYQNLPVVVETDPRNGLHYVLHNRRRLYFPGDMDQRQVVSTYRFFNAEQDVRSPHRYLDGSVQVWVGDTVVDVGAAEASFSLDLVEKAGRIVIFEGDPRWYEALLCTFRPWQTKVEIVPRFVMDSMSKTSTTLDEYFGNDRVDLIKIDAEGCEQRILHGAEGILRGSNNLRLSVCTYHTAGAESEVQRILHDHHFKSEPSHGYVIFYFDADLTAPYMRRALVRAWK